MSFTTRPDIKLISREFDSCVLRATAHGSGKQNTRSNKSLCIYLCPVESALVRVHGLFLYLLTSSETRRIKEKIIGLSL